MERLQQIEEIFQEALQRDFAERDAYVRQACRGDTELEREVSSLLANHKEASLVGASLGLRPPLPRHRVRQSRLERQAHDRIAHRPFACRSALFMFIASQFCGRASLIHCAAVFVLANFLQGPISIRFQLILIVCWLVVVISVLPPIRIRECDGKLTHHECAHVAGDLAG